MDVKVTDNSAKVIMQMKSNISKALTALGQVIVELTTDYMESYYGKPIYLSGDLIRSITFKVNLADKNVQIGSNLDYATWVHNGTQRMPARPFLKDAIFNNKKVIEEVTKEHLGSGFSIKYSL